MANLSTNNARLTVKFDGLNAIVVENFDPDSDIWTVTEVQTADGEKTPDGFFNYWGMNAVIEGTLTVSGGSDTASKLRAVLLAQMRNGNVNSDLKSVSVIVENGDTTTTYSQGIMTTGKGGPHLGAQKLQNQPFNFKFGSVK